MALAVMMFASVIFAAYYENRNVSAAEKSVGLNYSFDFTDYTAENGTLQGAAVLWKNDVYKTSGLKIAEGTGDEPFCLSTWQADFSSGYMIYKVEADAGKTITALQLSLVGRVFHFQHEGCKDCRMEIFVSETDSFSDEAFSAVAADTSGISQLRTFDLTESVRGGNSCFVKIALYGSGNTWVNIEQLAFGGSQAYEGYEEEKVALENADTENLYYLPQSGVLEIAPKNLVVESDSAYEFELTCSRIGEAASPVTDVIRITQTGAYIVEYTVQAGGTRVYTASYTFYVLKDKYENGFINLTDDSVWDKSVMQDVTNYVLESGASIETVQDGITVDGQVSYLQTLPFDSRFNFVFRLSEIASNGYFRFAVLGSAGKADFVGMSTPGLYFKGRKTSSGGLLIDGYFSDGKTVSLLGQQVLSVWEGVHGIGFNRRSAEPYTGLDIYMDGVKYSSYACCYTVDTEKFMPDGQVYMAFDVSNCEFCIEKIVRSDNKNPVLKNRDGTEAESSLETNVGQMFTLPDYVMVDETDGVMPHSVRVTDPNGQEVTVQNNRFDVLYEGRYTLTYTATDYSGNTGTKVVRVTARLPQGAAQMRFDTLPEASGRKGVEYILPCPEVYVDGVPASIPVQVRVVEPDGTEQTLVFETGESEKKFIPEQIGDYEFYYSVSNDVATVYMFYDASIKLNVAAQDSYKDVFSSASWIGSGIRETENGILISASAYCPLPFEMSSGIELTVDLSGLGNKKAGAEDFIDCWAALAIGCAPQNTLFSAPVEGFIYFMFYREDSNYYINVLARCNGVDYGILNGYLLGESKEAVISVQKRTDSETYADNVYIYVNHTLADVATSSMISYSDITDNENFCYVSVSNFGSSFQTAETYKSLTIKKVTVCDQEDPTVQMSGIWIEEAKVGQTIVLPEVTVTDNLNNGLRMKVSFYAPDGKEIEYRAGNFTPDSVGVYYLIIKAVDDAGNDKLSVYSLNVTSEKEFPVWVTIGIVCGTAAVVACVVAAAVIIKKKYGKKARNE